MTVPEFVSLVDIDLEDLRVRCGFEMNRSAEKYCEQWRADQYLIRKPLAQSKQETYELSAGAFAAIRFAKGLVQPHHATTQSRLNTIITQISALALEIDGNEERRRDALLDERAKIDEQLKELEDGRYVAIDEAQAIERARDILSLAQEIPGDFVRVRNDFEQISRRLHETILNSEEGHADILEDLFNGVDQISSSPSGQSFRGFFDVLRSSELSEAVQDDVDAVLSNDRLDKLTPAERRALRVMLRSFQEQSQEVNEVKTSLSHGLRRFVQSREYMSDRELKRRLDRTLGKAHRVAEAHSLTRGTIIDLDLPMVRIGSVSKLRLRNPGDGRAERIETQSQEDLPSLSLAELHAIARETEIDFNELRENVNSVFDDIASEQLKMADGEPATSAQALPALSISQVLERRPATQGAASIVGLMILAFDHGRKADGAEEVHWKSLDGTDRRANVPRYEFFEKVKA